MSKTVKIYIDHHVAQAWGVNPAILNNRKQLLDSALRMAKEMKLTIVESFVHKFEPHGLSLVLVISESHLAIHTWPELGYMNIDVLSCSPKSNLENLEEALKKELSPSRIKSKQIKY